MSQDSLQLEFDRISQAVDGAQYERLRWGKTEGPVLAKLVELAHSAIEDRSDFEWAEEGATTDIKRFVLKVHGTRVIGIIFWVEHGHAMVRAEEVTRSKYKLVASDPLSAEFQQVNELWMAGVLQELFSRIQA